MCEQDLKLIEPTIALREEFLAMVKEYLAAGEQSEDWRFEQALGNFEAYVKKFHDYSLGKNLPEGWVPDSTYWLVENERKVLGQSSLRHRLRPALAKRGGHIGYYIRPSERRRGYGTVILRLTLTKAEELGLKRVLVTCDDGNIASVRIIEKCGGVLSDKVMVEGYVAPTRRYWIDLK